MAIVAARAACSIGTISIELALVSWEVIRLWLDSPGRLVSPGRLGSRGIMSSSPWSGPISR